jgi:hypothetical protein
MSKRKAELEDSHRADPEVPPMTPDEARECEVRPGCRAALFSSLGGSWGLASCFFATAQRRVRWASIPHASPSPAPQATFKDF